jgi:hypothetical protein
MFIAGVNDTCEKLFSGVNDPGEKFIAGVNDKFLIVDTGQKQPKGLKFIAGVVSPVSTTPPINFSAVSTTPANIESCQY